MQLITMILQIPDNIVRAHDISEEYCESFSKDCKTFMNNLFGESMFLMFSDISYSYYTESKFEQNAYAVLIKAINDKHYKYLERRYDTANNRFGLIKDSIPVFYEHGKNMTLQKQPHKRRYMKKRAEDQMIWQGAIRILSEGDEIYGKTKLYSARKI